MLDVPTTALTFVLARRFLEQVLPRTSLGLLSPYFEHAQTILDAANPGGLAGWPDKVRILPRGLKLIVPEIDPEILNTVYGALLADRRFQCGYHPRDAEGDKDYLVNPLGLVVRDAVTYLVCTLWGYDDPIQLALHRIHTAEPLDTKARRPPGFGLDAYIRQGAFFMPFSDQPIRLDELHEYDRMIAEIHSKISRTGTNLSDRLEDQLTGDVFGTFRYVPARMALIPFLSRAYLINANHVTRSLEIDFDREPVIDFWPWLSPPGVEPDVDISVNDGSRPIRILVEVKYKSGLSNDDEPATTMSPEQSRNQLVCQAKALAAMPGNGGIRKILIFLTEDTVYPRAILDRVHGMINELPGGPVELYWLSWHEIADVLSLATNHADAFERVILDDLLQLCRERKGFRKYSGFEKLKAFSDWSFKANYRVQKGSSSWRFPPLLHMLTGVSGKWITPYKARWKTASTMRLGWHFL